MRVMFLFYLKEKVSFLIAKTKLSNLQCNDSSSSTYRSLFTLEILQNMFRFYDEWILKYPCDTVWTIESIHVKTMWNGTFLW